MKTLLVNNTANTLINAKASLEKEGHEVVLVDNGVKAWIQLCDAKTPFEMVVSGWLLPQLDGLGLCKQIRSAPFSSEVYVVLLLPSSESEISDLQKGIVAGADDLIPAEHLNIGTLKLKLRTAARILDLEKADLDKTAQIEALNVKLEQHSTKDKLTGLYNRRSFHRHLEDRLRLARRMEHPISLLMLDIDRFKEYKEEYGHMAGDDIIKLITKALREHSRTSDFVARFGGEKFGIILPNTDAAGAAKCAEGLCKAAQNLFWESQQVTISIGAATVGENTYTTESVCDLHTRILTESDQALYQSQSADRNNVTHFLRMNNELKLVI